MFFSALFLEILQLFEVLAFSLCFRTNHPIFISFILLCLYRRMSVAAAGGAVSTHPHQPTQEQIRLARLIEDKKHDHPEVQEILRKVLDIVTDSNQDDALLALFDCDYDCERTVALLIEKGHEVASEWRTATNHKPTKKQQQKVASTKNGHGNVDENGQQRGNGNSIE